MTAHQHSRPKRRAALGGSIALLAVLGAGAVTLNQAFADTADGTSPTADTAPVDARSVTAALRAAVADVADGTASGFEGWHYEAGAFETHDPLDDSPERDSYAGWFTFTPADGSASALVRAGVGDKASMDYNQRTAEENFACTDLQEDCQVTTLPDGSLLKTYVERSIGFGEVVGDSNSDTSYETLTAVRMTGDSVIAISATNGGETTEAGNEVTRTQAVLSTEQLVEIVSQPWWGYDLPAEFAEAGAALPGYHETDSTIDEPTARKQVSK